MRRAILLAALIVMLGASSGMAGGPQTRIVTLSPAPFDTTSRLRSAKLDDTMAFTSGTFGGGEFTELVGQIVQTTADTSTATGLAADTVYFVLQTKFDHAQDSLWWDVWKSSVVPGASFDSVYTGSHAKGAGMRISVPIDSLPSMGNLFRFSYYIFADLDSLRQAESDGYIDPVYVWKALMQFRLR